jgi:hypothetical protein
MDNQPKRTVGGSGFAAAAANGLLALGVLIRVSYAVQPRSLWIDEVMLAMSIATRNLAQLLDPLLFLQVAPPGFLALLELAASVGGVRDQVLRIPPAIISILLLLVLWRLARRLLSPAGVVIALAVMAASPVLLVHADEAKPYVLDALVAATLSLAILRCLTDQSSSRNWWPVLLLGAVAPAFSLPSIFVLGGMVAALAVAAWRDPELVPLRTLAVAAVTWGASTLLLVLTYYLPRTADPYFARFWYDALPHGSIVQRLMDARRFAGVFLESAFIGNGISSPLWVILILATLIVAGLVRLARTHHGVIAIVLGVPGFLGFLAAEIGRYPLAHRLWIFFVPALCILLAAGVSVALSRLPASARSAGLAVAAALLLAAPVLPAVRAALHPSRRDNYPIREAVALIRRGVSPRGVVYISAHAVPAWTFYTIDWARIDLNRLSWLLGSAKRLGPGSGNTPYNETVTKMRGLTRRGPWGIEVIGSASGMVAEADPSGTHTAGRVAPEWPAAEVRRIRETGATCVRLVFDGSSRVIDSALLVAVRREGGVETGRWIGRRTRVYTLALGDRAGCAPTTSAPARPRS